MTLQCEACGAKTVLTAEDQKRIAGELSRLGPSGTHTVECSCGFFQFVLAARTVHQVRQKVLPFGSAPLTARQM